MPIILEPSAEDSVNPEDVYFSASSFEDPNHDEHGATHWQVTSDSNDYSSLVADRWVQYKNEFKNQDTQEGINLCELTMSFYNLGPFFQLMLEWLLYDHLSFEEGFVDLQPFQERYLN